MVQMPVACNSFGCGGMVFPRWAALEIFMVCLFLYIKPQMSWVLDWEQRSWIAMVKLELN